MKDKNVAEVLIQGRKYTIGGFESDEYMQKIATYINHKYDECKEQEFYRHLDFERRSVLLAVNMADDYYKEKKKASEYRSENKNKDKAVVEMKHEFIDLQEKLKAAEEKNRQLADSLEKTEKKVVELETKLKHRR